ncbi:MAG: hypothetical protein JRI72_13755 [Deltaproteobacteria bacterium]|nr:hypothetical protein [Deltaproteobacteria bacterium]
MKKWTTITNRQIRDLTGGLSYSAVSKVKLPALPRGAAWRMRVNQRFTEKLSTDSTLRSPVKGITGSLSHVKG